MKQCALLEILQFFLFLHSFPSLLFLDSFSLKSSCFLSLYYPFFIFLSKILFRYLTLLRLCNTMIVKNTNNRINVTYPTTSFNEIIPCGNF